MTKLTPDEIANLRELGYMVSSKEGQTFVENDTHVFEEDFGHWYMYGKAQDCFAYIDEFETVFSAIDYSKDLL